MLASSFLYSGLIILAWFQCILGGLLPTRVSRIFPSRIIPRGHLVEERQAGAAVPVATTQPQNITNTNGAETHNTPSGNQTGPAPGFLKPPTDTNADQVDCHDLSTGRSNKCWKELDLSSWVENWLETNWCHNQEGFSECFLRQNGFPALDCSAIKLESCSPPQSDSVNANPQQFYVAYNIYAINQFFGSWWTAVGSSASVAQNNIAEIVQLIDIPSDTPLILQDVLLTLQCIFALIPGPLGVFAANSWKFDNTWQSLAQILSNALNAAPNVGRYLFPADSAASQLIQIGELSHNFANVIMQVQSNLNQTISSVMANSTEFLAFASQGNFTAKPPSLPDQVNYLYYGFNTYLISQALNGNNVYGVIGVDTDPRGLATNGTKTPYMIDCQMYDETNVCDAWWYSENFGSAFTLDDFSHMNRNYNTQLSTLLGNYTTGQLLFEGAYTCHSEGNFGKPINITINAGGINTACISQLKVLTWNMACTSVRDTTCEFLEGLSQHTFFGGNPSFDVNAPQVFSVPSGYLGPLVAQSDVQLRRN